MSTKLFVGGLPWAMDSERLKEAFAAHGEIVSAEVILDRETGRSRGFGFVTYAEDDAAERALALDGQEIDGRRIRVDRAQERARGPGGPPGPRRDGPPPRRDGPPPRRDGPPPRRDGDQREPRRDGPRREGDHREPRRDGPPPRRDGPPPRRDGPPPRRDGGPPRRRDDDRGPPRPRPPEPTVEHRRPERRPRNDGPRDDDDDRGDAEVDPEEAPEREHAGFDDGLAGRKKKKGKSRGAGHRERGGGRKNRWHKLDDDD